MLTSDCPGSVELKRMLQATADRVGAKFAMLVGSDGTLEACSGHHDRFTVEGFASTIPDSEGWQQDSARTPNQARVYVDVFTSDEMARLYIRRITGDRYLVTAFDLDDGLGGRARIGGAPDHPPLCEDALLRKHWQ